MFDVENSRLEKEYGIIKSERENATPQSAIGKVIADIEKQAFDNADKEQEDVETNNGNENADVPASDDTDSYEEKKYREQENLIMVERMTAKYAATYESGRDFWRKQCRNRED